MKQGGAFRFGGGSSVDSAAGASSGGGRVNSNHGISSSTGRSGSFRDSVSTISKKGIGPGSIPETERSLYNKGTWVSIILLTFLFGTPFIKVNGHPLMLFNIIERKFISSVFHFWLQDFSSSLLAMLTFVVFIILFTVIFGRVWCGWAATNHLHGNGLPFGDRMHWIEGDYTSKRPSTKRPGRRTRC